MKVRSININKIPREAIIWLAGLTILYFSPVTADGHFSICPLYNLGFDFCPGCGIGRSITLLLHGNVMASFKLHPLGFFALLILSFRIVQLFYKSYKEY